MSKEAPYGQGDATLQAVGGGAALRRLVEVFYRIMDEAPYAQEIRAMHPANLEQSIDKLARFLSGWMGGPRLYQEKYGAIRIPHAHTPWKIEQRHAEAWLQCMADALQELEYPQTLQEYLLTELARPAQRIVAVNRHHRGA